MTFHELSLAFAAIAQTSSRTAITEQLATFLTAASAEEAKIISYLSLGSLRPPYEGTKFSLAERSIKKILEDLLELPPAQFAKLVREVGDLGAVASQGTWSVRKRLSIVELYEALQKLEQISGTGSQEERMTAFKTLLHKLEPEDAGLVVRMVLGKLRLGFSDMTLIDALSWMLMGDKSLHDRIEHSYNICADIGHIAYLLKQYGIQGLDKVDITLGIPIRPAAAERLPSAQAILEKIGPCVAQPKLDGFRLQIHIDRRHKKEKIYFFSRNLIDMSNMFPDLVAALQDLTVSTCIFEGEAIVYDEQTGTFTPFQETVKRKRKHDIETVAQELPLKLFLFDLLYLDGESMLSKEHHTRRDILTKLIKGYQSDRIEVIEERPIETAKELENYFQETVGEGLEGVVVKKPRSHYQPGKRNFNWVKLKRQEQGELEDTIDAVVLGYYYGRGKRAQFGIGAFLVGVYNTRKDTLETVAKIGTGLSDAEWIDLKKQCDKLTVKTQPRNVDCAKELIPDVWVQPSIVVVIRADEITESPLHAAGKTKERGGFALRFPRMMGYRPDKSVDQVTTVREIERLFEDQRKKK